MFKFIKNIFSKQENITKDTPYEYDNHLITKYFFPKWYTYFGFTRFPRQEYDHITPADYSWSMQCPTCNITLNKLPQRKTKCKNCGNHIYHKAFPFDTEKRLINDDENIEHEKIWNQFYVFKNAIARFSIYSQNNIWNEVEQLYKSGQSFCDIIDTYASILTDEKMKKWYFSEASWILGITKDFYDDIQKPNSELNEQYHFFTLLDGYFRNAKFVWINDLEQLIPLKDELKNPSLPHKECPHGKICNCIYLPYYPTIAVIGRDPNTKAFEEEKQFMQSILAKFSIQLNNPHHNR